MGKKKSHGFLGKILLLFVVTPEEKDICHQDSQKLRTELRKTTVGIPIHKITESVPPSLPNDMDFLESPEEVAKILYSVSQFLVTPYEANFHPQQFIDFASDYGAIPVALVCLYLAFIYFGSKIMAEPNKPFDMKLALAAWNAFLSTFRLQSIYLSVCVFRQ